VGNLKKQKHKMEDDVGIKILERLMELSPEQRHLVFHGSEPMMNYDSIKDIVHNARKSCKSITFSIQSNGTLFNKDSLHFLTQNNVGVGISLDGMAKHQNKNRPYWDGSPTYHDAISSFRKIKNLQQGISIIAVITKNNVHDLISIVEAFESYGADSILFCPANPVGGRDIVPNKHTLICNMQKVCDRYLKNKLNGENTITIKNFTNFLAMLFMPKTTSNCIQCGAGPNHPLLAIDIDGSIYPCDYFWGRDDYKIGSIFDMPLTEAINSKDNFRVYRDVNYITGCRSCNWKRFCGGGCPGGSIASGRKLDDKSYYCSYYKSMLDYVAKNIPIIHSRRMIPDFLN
jgi:uncharacterized protein